MKFSISKENKETFLLIILLSLSSFFIQRKSDCSMVLTFLLLFSSSLFLYISISLNVYFNKSLFEFNISNIF